MRVEPAEILLDRAGVLAARFEEAGQVLGEDGRIADGRAGEMIDVNSIVVASDPHVSLRGEVVSLTILRI